LLGDVSWVLGGGGKVEMMRRKIDGRNMRRERRIHGMG
jgi:hypothetical protein